MTYLVAINALERSTHSYCYNHDNYSEDRYAIVMQLDCEYYTDFPADFSLRSFSHSRAIVFDR